MVRSPDLTSSHLLEQNLVDFGPSDTGPRLPTIKEKLREAVPTATKLYDDYHPTYDGSKIKLKMKL